MTMLTRQQLCAALAISESTVRRLELDGLPCTPVGKRSKRYDLDECKQWLRSHGPIVRSPPVSASWPRANEFTEYCRDRKLRVYPSKR
jgi:hypothetical protein